MKRLVRGILVLAVLAFALAGAAWWLLHSETAWRWALDKAQSGAGGALRIEGPRGTPARELFIDRLIYEGAGFRVEVRDLAVRGIRLGANAGLTVDSVRVRAVDVALTARDASGPKRGLPPRIGVPVGVRIDRAEVGAVTLRTGASDLVFRRLGFAYDGGPARHRLDALTVESPWGGIALHGEIAAAAPFAVSAAGALVRGDRNFPIGAGVELSGDLDRVAAALKGAVAGVPVEARAALAPLAPRPLQSITAQAGPIDLARLAAGAPSTALTLELRGRGGGEAPLAGELTAANARPGAIDAGRLPLGRLESQFSTDFATVRLSALVARLGAGGTLTGSGDADPRSARLALRAAGLDLRALHSKLRSTRLAGALQLAVSAERQSLRGTLSQDGVRVAADVVRVGHMIDLRSFRASANGGELAGSGRLALGAPIGVTGRLALSRFDPSQFGDYPRGSVSGSAVLEGRLAAPRRIDARWTIEASELAGLALASRGSARIAGEDVSEVNAEAQLGATRVSARGAFGRRADELAWTLAAPNLAELRGDLAGRVRAEGKATGGWRDPRIAFSARAEALRLPGGIAAGSVSAKAALGRDRAAPLEVELRASDVDAQGVAIACLEARSSGSVSAHEVSVSAAQSAGAGAFRIVARARGGWSEASGWAGELVELRNDGRYPLRLAAPVDFRVASARVEVGRLEAVLGQGRILARESVWTPGTLSSSGEFTGLPAAWLLAPAGLAGKLESSLLLDGAWALRSDPLLNGTVTVRRAGGDLSLPGTPPLAFGVERVALAAHLSDGALEADVTVESRLAKLVFRGEAKPAPGAEGFGASSPVAFRAQADVEQIRALVQPFLAQARLDGRLSAELRGRGTLGEPVITGTVSGDALRFDVPPYGIYLKDGRLRAALEGESVRVTELSIRGGAGSFSASGTLPLRPAEGGRLDWHARDLGIFERPDMRLVVSGDGSVRLEGERVALTGSVRAGEGFVDIEQDRLPDLGNDVVVLGEPGARPKGGPRRLPVALDLQVDLGERLTVQGLGFDGKVTGNVRLTTDKAGELRAEGKITAKDATYLAYGQRLDVDPGVLIFAGAIDNPALQITAWRRNQAVEAGVQISGTARAPRAQLVSQPAVPDGEKLSWLVLGRPPDDATKADLALLQAAAGALLPRGSSVPLTRRIARTVGLDDITLRGNSELAQRVVAVGKRLSDRFYVSYEQAIGATAANLMKLDYTLSRRWSLRAEAGSITGLGLFYRYSWD